MAIDAEELVIQPFREVVERGKDAVANAEASRDDDAVSSTLMLRSARSLVREGERALQRLMPLWNSQVDQHGEVFTDAIRHNDNVLESQRRLEDLLYDLDDYIEVDTFDGDRFSQVQAASKSFALTLLETVKRMRFTDYSLSSLASAPSEISIPSFPQPGRSLNTNSRDPIVRHSATYQELLNADGRRPSSPDILGAERDCIHLISRPNSPTQDAPSPSTPGSRITAWVRDQTAATAGSWSVNNTIPEDEPISGYIDHNLDSLTLQDPEMPVIKFLSLPYSPTTAGSRASWYTSTGSYASVPRSSFTVPTSDQRTTSLPRAPYSTSSEDAPDGGLSHPQPTAPIYEDGLILADEPPSVANGHQIGLDSSLYSQRGFCPGAQKFRVRGKKAATKPVIEYASTQRSIARCVGCDFAQSSFDVELDAKQDARANFSSFGVSFRLRFLYKSHLASTLAFTTQFGCLFCAHKGHTVHADDATVFTTQDQFFRHLARHPQPLPDIQGVTVMYGGLVAGAPQTEDYDLHFPFPAIASDLPDATFLATLPSAAALKSHVKRYGRELEGPDGGAENVLKFVEGARIVGIEFPEKWKGRWCTGWHDGVWGAFPAKLVIPEPPTHLPGPSMSPGPAVTVRWKWDVKDVAAQWLPIDKDETIVNVSWLNQDDWCWWGTKKNGRAGLFPRSHVKLETLRGEADVHDNNVDSPKKKSRIHSFGLANVRLRRRTNGSSA
ncbi:Uu.00g007590.m01.CDS01 [Anthostomella pinea]|uniref:Uu.00g007590.m01.CDS01 n=1 Tax=Anthostomella pinea TaxID=933095 RepID=A0AAI8VXN4_9PEZI|nr:Uu.00g007590.m01.CDS01 [Anthostomella pinea]